MNLAQLCMGCMADKGSALVCSHCGFQEKPPVVGAIHLPLRTVLNERYLIGRILGEGGFGITYLAYDLILTLRLAIKEFLPRGFATRASDGITVSAYTQETPGEMQVAFTHGLKNFLEEARILARFNEYPGIVAVRDYFATNGTGYLVMNYLDGMTLKQEVAIQGGRLPFSQAFELLEPVMTTLREVHAAGLAHRDISPDNIYITRDRQVKLIDFGAARFALNEGNHSLSVIFKRGFAPMEQYHTHGRQGAWTDVYALAGTLYFSLTGQVPPEAPARVLEDRLRLPSALGVAMPGTTEAVLLKGLAVRVENRYRSIEAFQQDLTQAILEEKTQVLPARSAMSPPDGLFLETEALPAKMDHSLRTPASGHRGKTLGVAATLLIIAALAMIPEFQHFSESPLPPPSLQDTPPTPEPLVTPITVEPTMLIQPKLLIQLSTTKGTDSVYRVGEPLKLAAQLSEDGYLYCYYQDEAGRIARIYPNRYAPDSYLRTGQSIYIPGENAGFSIEFTKTGQQPEAMCLASKRELGAKLPAHLKVVDLEPVSVESLDQVINAFQTLDPDVTCQRLRLAIIHN